MIEAARSRPKWGNQFDPERLARYERGLQIVSSRGGSDEQKREVAPVLLRQKQDFTSPAIASAAGVAPGPRDPSSRNSFVQSIIDLTGLLVIALLMSLLSFIAVSPFLLLAYLLLSS